MFQTTNQFFEQSNKKPKRLKTLKLWGRQHHILEKYVPIISDRLGDTVMMITVFFNTRRTTEQINHFHHWIRLSKWTCFCVLIRLGKRYEKVGSVPRDCYSHMLYLAKFLSVLVSFRILVSHLPSRKSLDHFPGISQWVSQWIFQWIFHISFYVSMDSILMIIIIRTIISPILQKNMIVGVFKIKN